MDFFIARGTYGRGVLTLYKAALFTDTLQTILVTNVSRLINSDKRANISARKNNFRTYKLFLKVLLNVKTCDKA